MGVMQFGVARRSFHHNPWCGDEAFTYEDDERIVMAVVDGLGHTERAAHAAQLAVTRLGECVSLSLEEMVRSVDEVLVDTVGAALTIAVIHKGQACLEAGGIGNVELQLATPARVFRFTGEPGIVGAGQVRFRSASFNYRPGDIAVIYSDGIRSTFSAQSLIHILYPDPVRIARRILAEYARSDDDALVLVGCEREETA